MADIRPRRRSSGISKGGATNAELAALPKGKDAVKQRPSDLPQWVKLAIADHVATGAPYSRVCKRFNKSRATLYKYMASPAAKLWEQACEKVNESPEAATHAILRASLANVSVEYLLAYQAAIDAQDYREVAVMSRDILDRFGMKREQPKGAAKPTIIINLGAGVSLEAEEVETSFEIQEAEYVTED